MRIRFEQALAYLASGYRSHSGKPDAHWPTIVLVQTRKTMFSKGVAANQSQKYLFRKICQAPPCLKSMDSKTKQQPQPKNAVFRYITHKMATCQKTATI